MQRLKLRKKQNEKANSVDPDEMAHRSTLFVQTFSVDPDEMAHRSTLFVQTFFSGLLV